MSETFFSRHFVWRCTPESIEAGKVSLLACAEVIFSVAAYFWLTWYFDTYAFLVTSVVVAPFVLLRSDESVALGVKWAGEYFGHEAWSTRRRTTLFIGTVLAVSGSAGDIVGVGLGAFGAWDDYFDGLGVVQS